MEIVDRNAIAPSPAALIRRSSVVKTGFSCGFCGKDFVCFPPPSDFGATSVFFVVDTSEDENEDEDEIEAQTVVQN